MSSTATGKRPERTGTVIERAPAKLNLALHVRGRRADGYHELETLFAFCRDGDELAVERAGETSLVVSGAFAASLPVTSDNLVLAAHRAFDREIAPLPALRMSLRKELPVASGIGGGSADAAAALRVFAAMTGVDAASPLLAEVALSLGSDVPACLLGRTAIGRGRGEGLEPVGGLGNRPVLLVNPLVGVSTAAVFARWGGVDGGPLGAGGAWTIALEGRNDLEAPARLLAPVIGEVLDALGATAPLLARMSGSGATCFACYPDEDARDRAADTIAAARPEWWRLATSIIG